MPLITLIRLFKWLIWLIGNGIKLIKFSSDSTLCFLGAGIIRNWTGIVGYWARIIRIIRISLPNGNYRIATLGPWPSLLALIFLTQQPFGFSSSSQWNRMDRHEDETERAKLSRAKTFVKNVGGEREKNVNSTEMAKNILEKLGT